MTGIFDKENRREVLKPGQAGNLFRVYEDKPIYYDNWDIDIFYTEKFWDVTDLQDFTWTENGPVRATLPARRTPTPAGIAHALKAAVRSGWT